jgi:hypothetical protein
MTRGIVAFSSTPPAARSDRREVFHLPRRAPVRIALWVWRWFSAVFSGFLPVLGFWMIPLGLLILSLDLPLVRRWRRSWSW